MLCARCTRFSLQVAGDPFIELFERGALEQVAIDPDEPFQSYFSSNTVQICPVGALTGASYRFQARPFDLVSSPSVVRALRLGLLAAHRPPPRQGSCAASPATTPRSTRSGTATRAAGRSSTPASADRLTTPLIRNRETGEQQQVSWAEALSLRRPRARRVRLPATAPPCWPVAATPSRTPTPTPSSPARCSAPATSTSGPARARRKRPTFLRSHVIGRTPAGAFPAHVRRPRKGRHRSARRLSSRRKSRRSSSCGCARARASTGLKVVSVGAVHHPERREDLRFAGAVPARPGAGRARRDQPAGGAIVLVGERLPASPAASRQSHGWPSAPAPGWPGCPARAGERGALEAGLLPEPGARDLRRSSTRPTRARIDGLVVGGIDPADLPDPAAAREALARVPFLVSLELRHSAVTELADVVFPVAAAVEKAGTFVDWEGRERPFDTALPTVHHHHRPAGPALAGRRDGCRARAARRRRGPRRAARTRRLA